MSPKAIQERWASSGYMQLLPNDAVPIVSLNAQLEAMPPAPFAFNLSLPFSASTRPSGKPHAAKPSLRTAQAIVQAQLFSELFAGHHLFSPKTWLRSCSRRQLFRPTLVDVTPLDGEWTNQLPHVFLGPGWTSRKWGKNRGCTMSSTRKPSRFGPDSHSRGAGFVAWPGTTCGKAQNGEPSTNFRLPFGTCRRMWRCSL